jgi:drug/metabolite transporter (DMT)-like permease
VSIVPPPPPPAIPIPPADASSTSRDLWTQLRAGIAWLRASRTFRCALRILPWWLLSIYTLNLALTMTSVATATILTSTSPAFTLALSAVLGLAARRKTGGAAGRDRGRRKPLAKKQLARRYLLPVAAVVLSVSGVVLVTVRSSGSSGSGGGGGGGGGGDGGSGADGADGKVIGSEGDVAEDSAGADTLAGCLLSVLSAFFYAAYSIALAGLGAPPPAATDAAAAVDSDTTDGDEFADVDVEGSGGQGDDAGDRRVCDSGRPRQKGQKPSHYRLDYVPPAAAPRKPGKSIALVTIRKGEDGNNSSNSIGGDGSGSSGPAAQGAGLRRHSRGDDKASHPAAISDTGGFVDGFGFDTVDGPGDIDGIDAADAKLAPEAALDPMALLGTVGALSVVLTWPLLPILAATGAEPFSLPPGRDWPHLLGAALLGSVLSDLLYVPAVRWTSPLAATVAMTLTIPFAVLIDVLLKRITLDPLFVGGASLNMAGFVLSQINCQ